MGEEQKEPVARAFGKTLRRHRKARGWTQEQLALESGHQRVFISWLENGQKQASMTTLFSLARTLDVSPSQFICEVEKELAED